MKANPTSNTGFTEGQSASFPPGHMATCSSGCLPTRRTVFIPAGKPGNGA